MKIKGLIIEDELLARRTIISYLNKYFPNVEVCGEIDNIEEAVSFINKEKVDVVFLDIQLKKENGITILERVAPQNLRVIFTTAYNNYTKEAFNHKAFGYLLKPIDPIDFKEIMNRVIKDISYEDFTISKLKVPFGSGHKLIEKSMILRCESKSNYTQLYLLDGSTYVISKTLKFVENNLLDSSLFIRIHQSHLVNRQFIDVTKYKGQSIYLKTGIELPVSRSKIKSVRDILGL